jgi:organic radical activating enzyme
MVSKIDFYPSVKAALDQIGPGMCLAKWNQVTIHLATGHTHSCHHPNTHKIPLQEIAADPSALHNTIFKKQQRQRMLDGERPEECGYCWNVEDNVKEGNIFSDRVSKSAEKWSQNFDEIIENGAGNFNPTYLEVSFSNVCNFKCSYCSPEVSSKWMEEIEKHGPYPTSTKFNNIEWLKSIDKMPIPHKDYNPYVNAFWHWWPELYKSLKVFRITGGEPLLAKDTFKVLDYVIANPRPELELMINSNLCIPDDLFNKFIEKVKIIQEGKMVKSFTLFTSCEAHGKRAEYIRHGMDYDKWLANCYTYLEKVPNSSLGIMSTYNILSVTSYMDFMKDILKLNNTFNHYQNRVHPLIFDIPYLRYPEHMSMTILSPDYLKQVEDQVTFMYQNRQTANWQPLAGSGFYDWEVEKLQRVYHLLESTFKVEEHLQQSTVNKRKDFVRFVDEHDKRRGTNFLETFPEMAEFYHMCKALL